MNCQFKFGFFTKWEEEEEEIETTVKAGERQQIREGYEEDFRSLVSGKCEIYFVGAKHFIKAEVRFVRILFSQSDWLPETWKRDKLRYWRVL